MGEFLDKDEAWSVVRNQEQEGGSSIGGNIKIVGGNYSPAKQKTKRYHLEEGKAHPSELEATNVVVNGHLESNLTAETLVIKKKKDSKESASFTGNANISTKVVVEEGCEFSGKLLCLKGEVVLMPGSHTVGLIEADHLIVQPGATMDNVELNVNNIQATLSGKFKGALNLQPEKPHIKLATSTEGKGSEPVAEKSGSGKAS